MPKSGASRNVNLPFQEITAKVSSDELVKRLKVMAIVATATYSVLNLSALVQIYAYTSLVNTSTLRFYAFYPGMLKVLGRDRRPE